MPDDRHNSIGKLFAYGSLMLPEVLTRLIHTTPDMTAATLPDFRRGRLQDRNYPGIVPAAGRQVSGMLISGLNARELKIIDIFEDTLYDRISVSVITEAGDQHDVFTYCVAPDYRQLVLAAEWDIAEFRQQHLADFLAHIG